MATRYHYRHGQMLRYPRDSSDSRSHSSRTACILQSLKEQLKSLLLEGGSKFVSDVGNELRRGSLTWAKSMGSNLSLDEGEET